MKHVNESFKGVAVEIDGNHYENCTFEDVTFVYGGGEMNIKDCAIISFRFQFAGDLANGLWGLYQLFGTEGMLQVIRGFTDPATSGKELTLNLPGNA